MELNKYIDPKEYAELDKLSQRIENDQLNTINKADYEKLQELLTKDFFANQNEIATILTSLQKVLDKTIYG